MNKVYLNNGVYGMQTAAKYYYDKTLKIIESPTISIDCWYATVPCNCSPYAHPDRGKTRRDLVIDAFNGTIRHKQEATEAKAVPINTGLVARNLKPMNQRTL